MDKLTIRIGKRVDGIMKRIDEAIKEKHEDGKEFYGILIAPRDDIWHCCDILIPPQLVSGAEVKVPKKEGEKSEYERAFIKYFRRDKEYVVIGTIHSHNSMSTFFSGGDDEDLDNNAYFNLNEELPFIDIVWSDGDYKARVYLKLGKGKTKQTFVHEECETEIMEDEGTEEALELISKAVKSIERKLKQKYTIDEDKLDEIRELVNESIVPKMDVKKEMQNIFVIKEKDYSWEKGRTSRQTYFGGSSLITPLDNKMKLNMDFEREKNLLVIKCQNDEYNEFHKKLESSLEEKTFELTGTDFFKDTWEMGIRCKSKNFSKKLRKLVFKEYKEFVEYQALMEGEDIDDYPKRGFPNYVG